MSDNGARLRHLEATEYMLTYAGNPNGLLDAAQASLCYDTTTGNVYVNLDGAVSWALIGGGGGGGAPNSASYLVLGLNAGLTAERRFDPAARFAVVDGGPNADYDIDLAATGVVAGAYGSATQVGTFTVDAYGRLTLAANVAISGVPPVTHPLLGSTYHNDVVNQGPTRGSLIYGNATPAWDELVLGGITGSLVTRNATDVLWSAWGLAGTAAQTYTFPANSGNVATGAGSLTAATANDATIVNHTHAIADTSDGDTAPTTILSSGANGELRIRRLGVGTPVIAVNGTIALPDAGYIGNGAATARIVLDSSGAQDYIEMLGAYVGINDAAPNYHLDVNGRIGINGVQTVYNAGALDPVNFSSTLYIGNGGGSLLHTGALEATLITAVGAYALNANTTGYYNTAVGTNTMAANTTGNNCTAIGVNALNASNSIGNAAIGVNSLGAHTTGNYTVAIGSNSGRYIGGGAALTNSEYSVFVGYDTRPSADSQTNQIVIGSQAIGNGSNTTTLGTSSTTDFYAFGNHIIENQHFVGITGDVRTVWDSTNGRIDEQLDDAAGSDEWRVVDSGSVAVATVDSDGNGYFAGDITTTNGKYVGLSGDLRLLFDSTNGRIDHVLGDAAGGDEVRTVDSGGGVVHTVDSDGNGYFAGDVGIAETPTVRLDVGQTVNEFSIIFGADNAASDTRTDATRKFARIGSPHYTNAEEPVTLAVVDSDTAYSAVNIGGSTSSGNAATLVRFYTAANTTTLTGTERMRINSSGDVGIATTSPDSRLDIADGALTMAEMVAPGAPAANGAVIYAVDNGAGKTQLMVRFQSGAAQQIAIEP